MPARFVLPPVGRIGQALVGMAAVAVRALGRPAPTLPFLAVLVRTFLRAPPRSVRRRTPIVYPPFPRYQAGWTIPLFWKRPDVSVLQQARHRRPTIMSIAARPRPRLQAILWGL